MDDSSTQNIWPTPKFRFQVYFGDESKEGSMFQEVSGLDNEAPLVEYRHGDNPVFSTIKMPGLIKSGNITLKKGVFARDDTFRNWLFEIKMNTIKRQTVTIKLLDENGEATMQWRLNNALPTKITGADLDSSGNEVAIESLEIAHEGIVMG